ncbi:MAG: helix-turn-helix domain-containing protein [Clostridia bacterium]|nr:helix-turn-helix domain-containing protein [Clostridia bacterium]
MSKFSQRLKEVRESLGLNKVQFAEYVGSSPANITRYEKEDMNVSLEAVKQISDKLSINPGYLLGWEEDKYVDMETYKKIPLIGTIAAGTPILATENIDGFEFVSQVENVDFSLKVKGNSMIGARIYDGDIVYIKQQPDVENGEIAAVMINDENATLKRVYKVDGSIILHSENPEYKDMIFRKKEMKSLKILGKAISFKAAIK